MWYHYLAVHRPFLVHWLLILIIVHNTVKSESLCYTKYCHIGYKDNPYMTIYCFFPVTHTGLKLNAATDYTKLVLHIEKLYIYMDCISLDVAVNSIYCFLDLPKK